MMGNDAWLSLAKSVADTGSIAPDPRQSSLLKHGKSDLPLDLAFPEVFHSGDGISGFHAVLGNPPWDVVHYQTKEFLAAFDPGVMDAPTKRERDTIERRLLTNRTISQSFDRYKSTFIERKRLCDRMFPDVRSGGSVDLFQVFAARMLDCVGRGGAIGIVVPSSFHANEGTARLRSRFLDETNIEGCFTFENRKKLFDIHGTAEIHSCSSRGAPRRPRDFGVRFIWIRSRSWTIPSGSWSTIARSSRQRAARARHSSNCAVRATCAWPDICSSAVPTWGRGWRRAISNSVVKRT